MKRSNALVARWLGIQLASFALAIAVLLLAVYFLMEPSSDMSTGMYTGVLSALGPTCALLIPMTLVTNLFPVAMSFGSTRRGFFGAIQMAKLPGALLFPLAFLLFGFLYSLRWEFSFFAAACSGLLVACVGELMGTVCIRFGQKAMWLFVLLCAVGVACIGLTTSLAMQESVFIFRIVALFVSGGWPVMAAQLAGAAVCTAASWAILRRAEA